MADEIEHSEIIETIADIAEESIEDANRRAEEAEATTRAIVDASIEDKREQRLCAMEERLGSWENRLLETNQSMNSRLEEMTTKQLEMMEMLKTSSISPISNPPQIQVQTVEEPDVQEVAPVKMEALPEVQEEPITPIIEPKPETKGVPGKRKIRLL